MRILFFDTETTGLPKDWKAPVEQLDNWPRLVQIAWQVYNQEGDLLEEHEYIIKPVGFIIPSEASVVHKITTEKALKKGVDLLTILKVFSSSVKSCGLLVAHNYSYDYNIMGSELLRNGLENTLKNKEHICTMNASTDFCKISGPYGYKWPKLEELYDILFNETFNAHNALDDIRATARCFWELSKKNIISVAKSGNKPLTSISIITEESQKIIQSCWEISNKIQRSEIRDEVFKNISRILMDFGDKTGALNEVKKITGETTKSDAIFYISKSLIDQGKLEESINLLELISDFAKKSEIDFIIVKELLKLRKVSSAIEIASKMVIKSGIVHAPWRTDAFIEISKYYVDNGEDKLAIISHELFIGENKHAVHKFIIEVCCHLANSGEAVLGHEFINHYFGLLEFDVDDKDKLFKNLPAVYQKQVDGNGSEEDSLILQKCLKYCKSGLIDNALDLLKKVGNGSSNIILEIVEELLFNQNDLHNSLFVASKYKYSYLPFFQYQLLITKSLDRKLPQLAYKILPSISDEDYKIKEEVKILIHLGNLDKAENIASRHSYAKHISEDNPEHKYKEKSIQYFQILELIIDKYLDLHKINEANILFKKIGTNEYYKDSLKIIQNKIIDKTVLSLMINGEYDKAEKIVNEANYSGSNLSAMFMASGHLNKALEHAKSNYTYYNIILVLLHRKKIDVALEVFELMSYPDKYTDTLHPQFIDFKRIARDEIIKSLLLDNKITNDLINKRISIALNLCKDNLNIVVKVLCTANLHLRAIKIVEDLPSKEFFVGNYIPNRKKDEYYVIIAESLLNSISSGKGLVHEVLKPKKL